MVPPAIDRYFELTRRGTTLATEVRGGCVTFLTMSYILLVNPHILGAWAEGGGAHSEYVANLATATAVTCGIGCILVGLLARLPLAIGPGMGLNTLLAGLYIATCEEGGHHCDVDVAEDAFVKGETTTCILGLVVFALSLVNATQLVLLMLPSTLKTAIMVGIGAFQAFVGLRWMHIIQPAGRELLEVEGLGRGGLDFDLELRKEVASGWAQLLFALCLILMSALFRHGTKGSILIAIAVTTSLSWIADIGGGKAVLPFSVPSLQRTTGRIDVEEWLQSNHVTGKYMAGLTVMFLITVFDVAGVQFGIAKALDLPSAKREARAASRGALKEEPEDGELLPGRSGQMVFAAVGITTVISSLLGCSPCIVFLECAAGVREGARTGLASLVTGVLFFVSCFFTPVFQHVPICASAAPLVFVGCLMMGPVGEIDWNDLNHALPAFLCILMMPFTASITWGIIFGMATYILMQVAEVLLVGLSQKPPAPTPDLHNNDNGNNKEGNAERHGYALMPDPGTPKSSKTKSIAKLMRKETTGTMDLVEEIVPIQRSATSPLDEITRWSPPPRSAVPTPPNSVVTTSLIGAPR